MASDVGGGTSLSMLRTLADAYKVQALAGHRLTAWKALHAATLGAATSLGLAHEIGSLSPGCMADVCAWDWALGPVAQRRMDVSRDLHEQVFAWMTLADERNLAAAYVAGAVRHERAGPLPSAHPGARSAQGDSVMRADAPIRRQPCFDSNSSTSASSTPRSRPTTVSACA